MDTTNRYDGAFPPTCSAVVSLITHENSTFGDFRRIPFIVERFVVGQDPLPILWCADHVEHCINDDDDDDDDDE